jgi:hypothetical protein
MEIPLSINQSPMNSSDKPAKQSPVLVFEEIPPTVFPALFSDEEFDEVHLNRSDIVPAKQENWDNRQLMAMPPPYDGKPESTIEQRFPHIAKHLIAMWGSEACALYLKRLMIADRAGKQGFPAYVMEDLIMLDQINDFLLRQKRATHK